MLSLVSHDLKRYNSIYTGTNAYPGLMRSIALVLTNAGLFAIVNHRFGNWILANFGTNEKKYIRYFFNLFYYLGKKISTVWGKIEILDGTPVGKGFFIDNRGGVFLGADSIGDFCTISNKVTMGMDQNGHKPTLMNDVCIGENSIIYGKIKVGEKCVICNDSVLTKSVPTGLLLSGNPARVIQKNIDPSDYCNNVEFYSC